jgi:hypothetical protein
MITNPKIIKDTFKCNKIIKEYLIFKCHIPLLGYDEKYFYFANTDELRKCLKEMPFGIKLLSVLSR